MKYVLSILLALTTLVSAQQDIDKLIQQMGADSYKDRKAAEMALWELLPDSEEPLREAAQSSDPEISIRARRVLEKYDKGIMPGVTEEIKAKIAGFWTAGKKSTYLRDWIYNSEFEDIPHVITLIKLAERKGEKILIRDIAGLRNFFSRLYFKYGSKPAYKYFIRKYAEQGYEDIYLHWVKANNLTQQEIAAYEKLPAEKQTKLKGVMLSLYRLAGDLEKAQKLAEGDSQKELSIKIQKGEFSAVLQERRLIQSTQAIGEEKARILFGRLAGNKEEYSSIKADFIENYGTEVKKNLHYSVMHALVGNGEVKEAEQVAGKLDPLWYVRLLSLSGDKDKILKYGQENNNSQTAAYIAFELSRDHQKEEALKWLEKVKLTELSKRWLYYYAKAYSFVHGLEAAFNHIMDNLDSIEANSRYQIYYALCPDFTSIAGIIVGYRSNDLQSNFSMLKKFVLKQMDKKEMGELYDKLNTNRSRLSESRSRYLYQAAVHLEDEEIIATTYKDYIQFDSNKLTEAKKHLLNEEPQKCLEILKSVKPKDRELKLYLYLKMKSHELQKDDEKYQMLKKQLLESPTWDMSVAEDLLELIYELGDDKLAAEMLSVFGYVSTFKLNSVILPKLIEFALDQGNINLARFYSVYYYLNRSRGTMYLFPQFALQLYENFVKVDFIDKLSQKKVEESLQIAIDYQKIAPLSYTFHVFAVHALKKRGYSKEAEKYFKISTAHYLNKIENNAKNSTAMNDWAWSAALCDYQLDLAETRAEKAIELDPDNANIWDTLAEIQFRKGLVKDAVKSQTRAVELISGSREQTFRTKLFRFKQTLRNP